MTTNFAKYAKIVDETHLQTNVKQISGFKARDALQSPDSF